MSINMDLMKEKLATLRGEGTREKSHWFKPDEGDQDIRIVPAPDGDPLKEMYFHYNVGDHRGGITCPKRNFGETCPICEFASQLWREGVDKNDEESKKLAKSLFVRARYFSPVVLRGREEELSPPSLIACLTLTLCSSVILQRKSTQSWMRNWPVTEVPKAARRKPLSMGMAKAMWTERLMS